eukprot:1771380-Alexandrium_andersonii.AAC.1
MTPTVHCLAQAGPNNCAAICSHLQRPRPRQGYACKCGRAIPAVSSANNGACCPASARAACGRRCSK